MSLPAPGSQPSAADEPLITALVSERCPACGARLAPAAQWCSLCYADLRPAPNPPASERVPATTLDDALPAPREASPQVAAPGWATAMAPTAATTASPSGTPGAETAAPASATTVAAAAQPTAPGGTARPTWPCSSCGVSVDVDLDACPACGTGFLGALRNSSTGLELPVVGDLGRFSQRSRIVLASAFGLGIALILVLITALLGH